MNRMMPSVGEVVVTGAIGLAAVGALQEGSEERLSTALSAESIENGTGFEDAGRSLLALKMELKEKGFDVEGISLTDNMDKDPQNPEFVLTVRMHDGEVIEHSVPLNIEKGAGENIITLEKDLKDFSQTFQVE